MRSLVLSGCVQRNRLHAKFLASLVGVLLIVYPRPVFAEPPQATDSARAIEQEVAGESLPLDSAPPEPAAQREEEQLLSHETLQQVTEQWVDVSRLRQVLPTVAAFALLGIAPVAILLTTGFIRISIVLALLRQAFGTAQIPSNQILTAISALLTLLLMLPVWTQVYEVALVPLGSSHEPQEVQRAIRQAQVPVRDFMIRQLQATESSAEVWLFWRHAGNSASPPGSYEEVPLRVLLPAFVLSELKTAFLIGFQIFLPFLVIDLVVATITLSMGLSSLPNQTVALPLKMMLFVVADGWHLVVDLLLRSFVS